MSFIVFILSISIIILLTKSNRRRRRGSPHHHQNYHYKDKHLLSFPSDTSHMYTNDVLYRTNTNDQFLSEKKNHQRFFPIKSEFFLRPIPYPKCSSSSSHSLPSTSPPPPPAPKIPPTTPQPLSVRRLYRSYV